MNTTTDAGCGAVAGQVERPVRPAAWMVRQGARTYYVSDAEFVRSSYDSGEFVPLYPPEAMSAERERCAKPVPDEWLVKVRRLVQGFEHVSGIARLWEPDYSSGSDRALWSRATEACADVAKLLREADGPNARLSG